MGSSKKGGQKRRVVDYFMSMHYGICTGPVDELLGIKVKDKVAWEGNVTANTTLAIDRMQLFGGDEKEGGVRGNVDVLFGGPTQVLSNTIATKFGLTGATMPGYRGVMSLFFYGTTRGFLWCQNNPYLPPVAATVRRRPLGLANATGMIVRDGITDANPAHIIYECYTNNDWSLGWPIANFNIAVWEAVAQTLFNEGFGMSLQWVTSTEVEKFIAEIQDHIQAVIYEEPSNGLLSIKLIRDDYLIENLFIVDPTNASLDKAERRALDDTVNEIIVTWTNPLNEKEETVTVQDLGNIASQGRIVSESRAYYGVRTQSLAMTLAKRDLRASSYPLFSCEASLNRTARQIVPGDVINLVWPELGILSMACRVMDIDYGKPGSGEILLTLIEDIFGLEEGDFSTPSGGSLWTDIPETALPLAVSDFLTAPYPILSSAGLSGTAYPGVYVGVLAREEQDAMSSFTLSTEYVLPNGTVEIRNYTGQLPTSVAATTVAMVAEAQSSMTDVGLGSFTDDDVPSAGTLLYVAGTGDAGSELMMVVSHVAGVWTLARGIYDTVPRVWPIGTLVWSLSSVKAYDPIVRSPGAPVSYWLRPVTLAGTLPLLSAAEEIFTPTERPHAPFRPTNIRVEGVAGFGTYRYSSEPVDVSVSWSNRNRTMEDTVALLWAEASVTGEVGQTSTVRVRTIAGALISQYPLIAGTTFDIPTVDWITTTDVIDVQVVSVRDGIESLQYQTRRVELPIIRVPSGTYALTGYAPTTFKRYFIGVPVGSYTLISDPPDMLRGLVLYVPNGVYTLEGYPVILFGTVQAGALRSYALYKEIPGTYQIGAVRSYALYKEIPGTYQIGAVRSYALYRIP